MANVTDIGKERRRRTKKKADTFDPNELAYNIALKIDRHPLAPHDWPIFPHRFHVFQDDAKRRIVLEEPEPGIVTYRDESAVTNAILSYCWEMIGHVPGSALSHKQGVAAMNLWRGIATPLAERPLALAERSTPGLAFHRLPFDAPAVEPEPLPERFLEFLSRCSQPQAVAAFIGSLFYPDADRQQYLYFYGEGQDGKGSLLRMLFRLFGSASQSLQPKRGDDRFWNMKTYGKRLVMFPDCDDFRFFGSPEFKSLTGNDPLFFEEKGKPGFTDIPSCKIIAASNHRPNITSQKSDLRRLVYIDVAPVTEGSLVPNYEDLLYAEAEAIVSHCKTAYQTIAPDRGPIPCEAALDVAFESEEDAFSLFNKHFVFTGNENHTISGAQVRDIFQKENVKNSAQQRLIREVWCRQLGVQIKHTRKGNIYYRMRKRTDADTFDVLEGEDP